MASFTVRMASAGCRAGVSVRSSANARCFAGRRVARACSNRSIAKTSAFFNFNKNNDYNAGGAARDEYESEDVEFYFNYMGMLATEGTYDRMYELMKGRHPCDAILLMAAKEGDVPKLLELIESGADLSVTDPDGKTAMDLATKPEALKVLEEAKA